MLKTVLSFLFAHILLSITTRGVQAQQPTITRDSLYSSILQEERKIELVS